MQVGELIAEGRTADVHAYGANRVIKMLRPNMPSDWASIEAEISTAVHRHGLPAPELLDVVRVDGRSCLVFERIDGISLWQQMHIHPEQVASLTLEMVKLQHEIHAAGIPIGVPDLPSRLRAKVSDCDVIEATARAEATCLIARLPKGAALLHGDFHPGNILLGPDGPMVIDWFDATIGHPISDVVRTSLLLRLGFDGAQTQPETEQTPSLLERTHDAYLDAWRFNDELGQQAANDWEPVLALSRISERADKETAPLLQLWDRRDSVPA